MEFKYFFRGSKSTTPPQARNKQNRNLKKDDIKTMNEEAQTDRVNTIRKKLITDWIEHRQQTTCRYCGRKHKFDKKIHT